MKKIFLAASMALVAAVSTAQTKTVTFTDVLDVSTPASSAVVSADYVPGADKFVVGHGDSIEIFDGQTGAKTSDLSINGISPSVNGFFALVAADDGTIYSYENGGKDIWRWDSIDQTDPYKVFDTVAGAIQRMGDTATVSGERAIAFTGEANNGPVEFFSESFPYAPGSFTFNEAPDLDSKSGLALNADATSIYTVGDAGNVEVHKFNKVAGVWTPDTTWIEPTVGGGPMAYDDVNDVLFILRMTTTNIIVALDGTTGATLGTFTVTSVTRDTSGYCGGYVEPSGPAGTIWMAAPGNPTSDASLHKLTYAVTTSSTIDDWSLYKP